MHVFIYLGSALGGSFIVLKVLVLLKKYLSVSSRVDTPLTHHTKKRVVTLGGLGLILPPLLCMISFFVFSEHVSFIIAGVMSFFGIGLIDDCKKLLEGRGITTMQKALLQGSIFLILFCIFPTQYFFLKNLYWSSLCGGHIVFVIWLFFVIVGSVNAVNIVDGIDFLTMATTIPILLFLLLVAFLKGFYDVTIVLVLLLESCIVFSFFNKKPASVWMGDSGSLALGGLIGLVSLVLGVAWLLPFIGIVLVGETFSVIIQIISRRLWKKKVFKIAPFHHHLQEEGFTDNQIVLLSGLMSLASCILGGLFFLYIK